MKKFVAMWALAAAIALTGPAFAQDVTKATTKADCEGTLRATSVPKSLQRWARTKAATKAHIPLRRLTLRK